MNMSNNKISQLQIISLGCCYILGTIVVSVFVSSVAAGESWMIGIFGAVCFIPVLLIYFSLMKKHPGKGLFEINEAVFGSVGGRILSCIYLVFFLSLCALNILEASNFLHYFIIPETPLTIIAVFFMAACAYCVKKGIAPIARVSTIFLMFGLLGLLFNILMSFNHAKLEYLLPIFNLRLLDYIQSTHIAAAIPFGESFFMLMLVPRLGEKASMKKAYVAVTIFTLLIMVIVHFREVISLGPMISFATLPSYEAVRMIDISNILSRTESLFALLLVSLTFFKTLILFYVCLAGTSQIFRLDSYRHLIIMLALFLVVYAVEAYGSPSSNIFWGKNVSPFIWNSFTVILPLVTLVCSQVKSLIKNNRRKRVTQS